MVEINLLPWRQQVFLSRQKNKKIFLSIALMICVCVFGSSHFFLLKNLSFVTRHTLNLEGKARPAKATELNHDIDRLEILTKLQASREKTQNIFANMERAAFYSIRLIRVRCTAKEIMLEGFAHSVDEITHWLKNFKSMRIKTFKVEQAPKVNFRHFYLVIE
jgi:Tfp pilus assembly protein PilN